MELFNHILHFCLSPSTFRRRISKIRKTMFFLNLFPIFCLAPSAFRGRIPRCKKHTFSIDISTLFPLPTSAFRRRISGCRKPTLCLVFFLFSTFFLSQEDPGVLKANIIIYLFALIRIFPSSFRRRILGC